MSAGAHSSTHALSSTGHKGGINPSLKLNSQPKLSDIQMKRQVCLHRTMLQLGHFGPWRFVVPPFAPTIADYFILA